MQGKRGQRWGPGKKRGKGSRGGSFRWTPRSKKLNNADKQGKSNCQPKGWEKEGVQVRTEAPSGSEGKDWGILGGGA